MKRISAALLVCLLLGMSGMSLTAGAQKEAAVSSRENFVIALQDEPSTLDIHISHNVYETAMYLGSSLITKDPVTGEYLPYLAESYSVSDDGMVYEFTLRDDVLFHDGTPLTAEDYAWTFNRAVSVPVQSTAGATLLGMIGAEAIDERTFQVKMAMPNSTLLDVLSRPTYHQPLLQAAVEGADGDYGRNPVGVGPYVFGEWITGSRLVLEKNPDFAWGPAGNGGPDIPEIEFRFIPEYSTRLAGLESGEIDYMRLEDKDVERIGSDDRFKLLERLDSGSGYTIVMNITKEPFNDLRFRQALNYAVDRQLLVNIAARGYAVPNYGPLSPGTFGYWEGVEEIGYRHNPDKAAGLLAEMGWSAGADGILVNEGEKLSLVLDVIGGQTRTAEILQQQFKEIGIEVTLRQKETAVLYADLAKGDFQFALNRYGWLDYGLMFAMYHPQMMGNLNHTQQTQDEMLNNLLGGAVFGPNKEVNDMAIVEAQRRLVQQAYSVPLYTSRFYYALNKRITGVDYIQAGMPTIFDAGLAE
jgi:peptide/nickel transport system substrate-binding protein